MRVPAPQPANRKTVRKDGISVVAVARETRELLRVCRESQGGAMFFQQKKQASQGRENLFAAANKLFLIDSRPRNKIKTPASLAGVFANQTSTHSLWYVNEILQTLAGKGR